MAYEVPLKVHLSNARIAPTATLMSKGFYKIDIITDIKGCYESAYLEFHVINEDGEEAQI